MGPAQRRRTRARRRRHRYPAVRRRRLPSSRRPAEGSRHARRADLLHRQLAPRREPPRRGAPPLRARRVPGDAARHEQPARAPPAGAAARYGHGRRLGEPAGRADAQRRAARRRARRRARLRSRAAARAPQGRARREDDRGREARAPGHAQARPLRPPPAPPLRPEGHGIAAAAARRDQGRHEEDRRLRGRLPGLGEVERPRRVSRADPGLAQAHHRGGAHRSQSRA